MLSLNIVIFLDIVSHRLLSLNAVLRHRLLVLEAVLWTGSKSQQTIRTEIVESNPC